MPKFQLGIYGEWFYTAVVKGESVADAQEKMAEMIRDGELQPIHGPGLRFGAHRVIEEPETR
jgi:hypothetical protein